VDFTQPLPAADQQRFDQRSFCYWLVDQYLEGKGSSLQAEDRERLARAVTVEVQRVVQGQQAYLRGQQEIHVGRFEVRRHGARLPR
jgi:hypothetical protein